MKLSQYDDRFWRLLLFLLVLNSLAIFGAWCILDFITVSSSNYPENIRDGKVDIYVYLLFVPLLAANFGLLGRWLSSTVWRIAVSIFSAALSLPLAAILIWHIGLRFHFATGGSW